MTALCALAQPFRAAEQLRQQPPVQFETRADLILVDANIIDKDGTPIADLTRDDFVVSIDGQPRPLASVQFVKSEAPSAAPPARATHYSSNEGVSDGRQIAIVVDENSFPPGGARGVLMSIERFLKSLSPADRIALLRLPRFEGSVDFTVDHQRVFEAVKKVIGRANRAGLGRVMVAEAVAYERQDNFLWERAVTRICGNLSGQERALCVQDAENDASEKSTTYLLRARETVQGLAQVIDNLRPVPGPKTIVLLSQGFLSYDLRAEISRLSDAAATARVSLYALHIDIPGMDLDLAESSATRMDDERLMAEGIDDLAGASRGTRFRIVGSAEGVFARVARELSGYYLLGVEPIEADRDGKPHRIKVDVKRPAATVRARTQFVIGAGATADKDAAPANALLEILRAPTPQAGIPLRVTAFATPGNAPDRVTLIVGADIGPPTVSPLTGHIGLLVVDNDSKVVGNQFAAVTLRPDSGERPSVPRYIGNVEIPQGNYTLRFAVVDAEGHSGSVHHPVEARLRETAGIGVSDLILMIPVRGLPPRPEVHLALEGEALQAVVQIAASNPPLLNEANVTFEVAEKADAAPIVSVPAQVRNVDGRAQPAAILDVAALAPGSYLARAVVTVAGQKPITSTRPFEIAPRRPSAVSKSIDAGASPTVAVSRSRIRPAIPPFKPQDVLAPAVVTPFVDHVLASYSPSPAAREALNAIKAGNIAPPPNGDRQIGDVGLSFAQGLRMLSANRPAEADAYFRAALRSASDFIGAAFYLGATLAAAGKDREAVAAWQTALIGDVGAAGVYPVLIDGLLRLREGEQALELLKEAEPTFTDRLQYKRRLVQAYAVLGRLEEALPRAHEYLSEHPADTDLLFLTMQMIYEAHAAGALSNGAAEIERFRDYAARYDAARGGQMLVVQGWRKALGIR